MSAIAAAAPARLDRRGLGVLSFGHLSVDLAQGTVPALLPFLVRDRGYSYAAAGALLLFSGIGSSFLQPLLGAFADRIRAGWMMPVGTLLAAGGVALSGQFDSYLATGGVLVISSIGVAMYHPEAVRFASYVSRGRRPPGHGHEHVRGRRPERMGARPDPDHARRRHCSACAGRRSWPSCRSPPRCSSRCNLRYFEQYRPTVEAGHVAREDLGESNWPAFTIAAAAGTLRTGALFGFQAFVPLYVWRTLHSSEGVGNAAIAAMLAAGAVGTLFGGRLSDLHGFRRVIVFSLVVSAGARAARSRSCRCSCCSR